ncbi:uncharacterized protein METZ01_LOCUS458985, partial [marine metagenome]
SQAKSRALDSAFVVGQSPVVDWCKTTWPSAVAAGGIGGLVNGLGFSRTALGWVRLAGSGCLAGCRCRAETLAVVRPGLCRSAGFPPGFTAVPAEYTTHGRGDRRLAGIEPVLGAVPGGLGVALWRFAAGWLAQAAVAVVSAARLWAVCRCQLGGIRNVAGKVTRRLSVELSRCQPVREFRADSNRFGEWRVRCVVFGGVGVGEPAVLRAANPPLASQPLVVDGRCGPAIAGVGLGLWLGSFSCRQSTDTGE